MKAKAQTVNVGRITVQDVDLIIQGLTMLEIATAKRDLPLEWREPHCETIRHLSDLFDALRMERG